MLKHARRAMTALIAATGLCASVAACPFCPVTAPTLSEQQAQSDVVVLAQWAGGDPEGGDDKSYTTYEVLQILKAPAGSLKRRDRVQVTPFYEGQKGNLFLLMGTQEETIRWDAPQEITETGWQYVAQAPNTESQPEKRLAYFLRFLEYPDDFIAADAFAEFTRAKYEDVAPLAKSLDPARVRQWLDSPRTPQPRLGFYGMLLGLCGTADDAQRLEARILDRNEEFRLGIDGIMGGYLLLTGAEGLDLLDRTTLADPQAPVSDVYAAMSALRFVWTYGEGRIDQERLRQSMRQLLDRADVADLAITDLARWKDWGVQERLADMFDAPFADATTRRTVRSAIIGYMLAAARDVPDKGATPEHAARAKAYLEAFRAKDPVAVRNAERFGS